MAVDTEIAVAGRKMPQGLVDEDDAAVRPQQRNAVDEQIERVLEQVFATRSGRSKELSHGVGSLKMRAEAVHQRDLAIGDVLLPARSLHRYEGDPVRGLLQHRGD